MKVSVVIPAHNEEKFLPRALRAILDSDYPDFEVIVVDNASTDGTSRVAKSFPEVKLVHEQRKGTNFAREAGRKAASGEIIASMDSDCLPGRDWLRRGVWSLEKHNAVAVTGPGDYFDGSQSFRYLSLYVQKLLYYPVSVFLSLTRAGGILFAANCLVRSSALEAIGGYDTSLVFYGDDTDTAKRLSKIGKVAYDNGLVLKCSARRFMKEGVLRVEFMYVYSFFKMLLRRNKQNAQAQDKTG